METNNTETARAPMATTTTPTRRMTVQHQHCRAENIDNRNKKLFTKSVARTSVVVEGKRRGQLWRMCRWWAGGGCRFFPANRLVDFYCRFLPAKLTSRFYSYADFPALIDESISIASSSSNVTRESHRPSLSLPP